VLTSDGDRVIGVLKIYSDILFMNLSLPNLASFQDRVVKHRSDFLIAGLLIALAGFLAFIGGQMVDTVIWQDYTEDVWFGSDIERVVVDMSVRYGYHGRIKVHPLFTLLTFPVVTALQLLLRVSAEMAIKLTIAGTTAIWAGVFFWILRVLGCRRFDATLFSVLALSSAGVMFWVVLPETYLFGSLSMLVPVLFIGLSADRARSQWWAILVSAFSFSMTTTNWMVGIFAAFARYAWQRAIFITIGAFLLVLALWRVQKRFFPGVGFLLDTNEEKNYILPAAAGGPLRVLIGFFSHSMVMPAMKVIPSNRNQPDWPMLSAQFALPGSAGPLSIVAVLLWLALLALGIWAFIKIKSQPRLRIVVALALLGQLVLYSVYGEETFLYGIHIIPFLIIVCATISLTPLRPIGLALATAVIITAGINNGMQFHQATEFLQKRGPLREQVPTQPWLKSMELKSDVRGEMAALTSGRDRPRFSPPIGGET
jgi:hypothetical protein